MIVRFLTVIKNLTAILGCFITSIMLPAQDTSKVEIARDGLYIDCDDTPSFVEGQSEMFLYFKDSIQAKVDRDTFLKKSLVDGKVCVKLIVDTLGYMRAFEVIKGCGNKKQDQLALEVVKQMPRWIPAKDCQGDRKEGYIVIPIRFRVK